MNRDDQKYKIYLDQFCRDLDTIDSRAVRQKDMSDWLTKNGKKLDLKNLTRDLVQNNMNQFSFLLKRDESFAGQRKIERIYSKNEIRNLVCQNLIPLYQNDTIINAVTDYLYSIHVTD